MTLAELREFARDSLADPSLPQKLVVLASLPQLPSGKLDRKTITEIARKKK